MQQQSHLLETSKSYKRTKSIAARFRLFMSVLIVFRFQFHLSGQKRNSTHKIDREKVMKID